MDSRTLPCSKNFYPGSMIQLLSRIQDPITIQDPGSSSYPGSRISGPGSVTGPGPLQDPGRIRTGSVQDSGRIQDPGISTPAGSRAGSLPGPQQVYLWGREARPAHRSSSQYQGAGLCHSL